MKISHAKRTAMQFVVLLGIVSLLGDMTYEGAQHHQPLPGTTGGQRCCRGGRGRIR